MRERGRDGETESRRVPAGAAQRPARRPVERQYRHRGTISPSPSRPPSLSLSARTFFHSSLPRPAVPICTESPPPSPRPPGKNPRPALHFRPSALRRHHMTSVFRRVIIALLRCSLKLYPCVASNHAQSHACARCSWAGGPALHLRPGVLLRPPRGGVGHELVQDSPPPSPAPHHQCTHTPLPLLSGPNFPTTSRLSPSSPPSALLRPPPQLQGRRSLPPSPPPSHGRQRIGAQATSRGRSLGRPAGAVHRANGPSRRSGPARPDSRPATHARAVARPAGEARLKPPLNLIARPGPSGCEMRAEMATSFPSAHPPAPPASLPRAPR